MLSFCEFTEFDNRLLSGQLIIVTEGSCNDECDRIKTKISDITDKYYHADIKEDENARKYLDSIGYRGKYPIYFYNGNFLSDVKKDPKLSSILNE